jgi:hypothetical protein
MEKIKQIVELVEKMKGKSQGIEALKPVIKLFSEIVKKENVLLCKIDEQKCNFRSIKRR